MKYLDRPLNEDEKYYSAPTVARFLELCAQLRPEDYAFFRERSLDRIYPEIDWPRDAGPGLAPRGPAETR